MLLRAGHLVWMSFPHSSSNSSILLVNVFTWANQSFVCYVTFLTPCSPHDLPAWHATWKTLVKPKLQSISPSSRTGNVSSLVNTNSFASALFEPQKEYKGSGIWNLMKYVGKDLQESTSLSLQILWQFIIRFMRLSNNKLILPTVHNLMIFSQYSLIQNKSTLRIYHPNYLLNSITWLVAVNFGSFWWFGRYVSCSPEYKSRSIFWSHFHVQKFDLYTSIYGT